MSGVCFDGDNVLIAKRSAKRKLFPELWECGGGQVEKGESFEDAVKRQFEEELGVKIEPIKVFAVYEIDVPDEEQKKIPGVKFICKLVDYVNGKHPEISGEHSEWKWHPLDRLDDMDFIPTLKEDIIYANKLVGEKCTEK